MIAIVRFALLLLPILPGVFGPVAAQAAAPACGRPFSQGNEPVTVDALFVLHASVDLVACNRCLCDVDDSGAITATDALTVLRDAVGLPVAIDCPACDPDGLECPRVAQFALFASIRGVCTTNADCAAFSACDTTIGRCRTATDADAGWTGLAHNSDTNDPVPARLLLDCDGPAPCGHCTIVGHDPSLGNCRCAGDNRQPCFVVAGPDQQFCGGDQCVCNFGPPLPLSSGNTPVCVINTLAAQPGGDVDVDAGSGTIQLHLAEKIFLGTNLTRPCPICVNDTTPADGVRNGVCVGGLNDTQSCDAQAYNSTFPPPTGALYSLDCFPNSGSNIAGQGLLIEIGLTTGRDELHADAPCGAQGAEGMNCPCRVCSGDETRPCRQDVDCSAIGAGTCSSDGGGKPTLPNACVDFDCENVGGEQGRCTLGPDDGYCDQFLRADGTGLVGCAINSDCAPENIGIDAGNCTVLQRRACFLDPIVTQGHAHPVVPLAGGTFCSAATTSETVNSTAGFPGPGRLTLQTAVSLFCKSDPNSLYSPGSGGCP